MCVEHNFALVVEKSSCLPAHEWAVAFSFALWHLKMVNRMQTQNPTGLRLFENPAFGSVRVVDQSGTPLFCLADICKAVELTNPSSVKQRLDAEDSQLIDLHALNPESYLAGNSKATFVNESAFYEVLLLSSSPKVKPFRKWITHDILPSIRKTGGYIQTSTMDTDEDIMAKALMIAQRTIEDKKQRIQMLEGENDSLKTENTRLLPKAQYTDEVLQSTDTITFTEIAKELNFRTANALTNQLIADRILYKQSGRYLPTAKYSTQGYFKTRVHKYLHYDGSIGTSSLTVITEKGRAFLHNHFNVTYPAIDCTNINIEALI